jgi:hypothetical protein
MHGHHHFIKSLSASNRVAHLKCFLGLAIPGARILCASRSPLEQAVFVANKRPRTKIWAQVAKAGRLQPVRNLVRFPVAAVAGVAGVARFECAERVSSEREVGLFGNCEYDGAEHRVQLQITNVSKNQQV